MNNFLLNELKRITPEEQELLSGKSGINRNIYMQNNSAEVDKALLLEKGKLITLRPHTRFAYFPKHTHNYVEMVYMCQGKTKHIINGSEVNLNAGELLILNQNATQEIHPAGEDDIAVNFIIWPQFFDTAISMIGEIENLIWTLVNHQANKRSINQLTMGLLFLQLVNNTEILRTAPHYRY